MSDGETEAARGRTWTKWPEDSPTPDLTTLEREVVEAAVTWHRVIGRDHTGECGHELGVACRLCDLAAPIRALLASRKPKGVKPSEVEPEPIPMRLPCPRCGELHTDEGEFATKVHHTHACQHCGEVWRPAVVPTVGVRFLPGFKNLPLDPQEPKPNDQ